MLDLKGSVAHFQVTTLDGTSVRYTTMWQHKNLVLLALPADRPGQVTDYGNRLVDRRDEFAELNTALVVTTDAIAGVDAPGVLVADK